MSSRQGTSIALGELSVFITGANGGMGLETSRLLVEHGVGRLVMAARTIRKAEAARSELLNTSSKKVIEAVGGFDMTDPEAIAKGVQSLPLAKPFDVVFLQAGGVVFEKGHQYVQHEGLSIERTVFQNAIGGYITIVKLLECGLIADGARVVFAGGEGARGIPGMIEKPVFDTVEMFETYLFGKDVQPKYNPMNAIGVSKLASALIIQKLASLNDGREYIWFTPGLTHGTNGLAKMPPLKRFLMEKVMFGISGLLGLSQSPKDGARKYVSCLLGEVGRNGDVLGSPEGKVLGKITDQKPMNPSLTDRALIDSLWSVLRSIQPMPEFAGV